MASILETRIWHGKLLVVGNLILLAATSLAVYVLQLVESNSFAGYQPLTLGFGYFALLVPSLLAIAALVPTSMVKPSDFFLVVYGIFVLAPYAIFHASAGPIGADTYAYTFGLLFLPALLVWLLGHVRFGVAGVAALSPRMLDWIVITLAAFAAVGAVRLAPASAGFGLLDVYERRLEAREIFRPGSFWAYATVIGANGLAPFLAFVAGFRSRLWLLLLSLLLGAAFFYVIGGKAPLAFLALAYLLGIGIRKKRSGTLHGIIFFAILLAFGVFVAERMLTELSLTAEFTFRRAFAGPAHVLANYFDLVLSNGFGRWSAWGGVSAPDGVTFLVGELYYGNGDENVDTNTFIHDLAEGGVLAFAGAVVLVCGTLSLLDSVYRATHNPRLLYLGFAFSILVAEQAAGTALLSSGIGLLTMLVYFSTNGERLGRRSVGRGSPGPGSAAPALGASGA